MWKPENAGLAWGTAFPSSQFLSVYNTPSWPLRCCLIFWLNFSSWTTLILPDFFYEHFKLEDSTNPILLILSFPKESSCFLKYLEIAPWLSTWAPFPSLLSAALWLWSGRLCPPQKWVATLGTHLSRWVFHHCIRKKATLGWLTGPSTPYAA